MCVGQEGGTILSVRLSTEVSLQGDSTEYSMILSGIHRGMVFGTRSSSHPVCCHVSDIDGD